jgi:hypothetical protein
VVTLLPKTNKKLIVLVIFLIILFSIYSVYNFIVCLKDLNSILDHTEEFRVVNRLRAAFALRNGAVTTRLYSVFSNHTVAKKTLLKLDKSNQKKYVYPNLMLLTEIE